MLPVWVFTAYLLGLYGQVERLLDIDYVAELVLVIVGATMWCWILVLGRAVLVDGIRRPGPSGRDVAPDDPGDCSSAASIARADRPVPPLVQPFHRPDRRQRHASRSSTSGSRGIRTGDSGSGWK